MMEAEGLKQQARSILYAPVWKPIPGRTVIYASKLYLKTMITLQKTTVPYLHIVCDRSDRYLSRAEQYYSSFTPANE